MREEDEVSSMEKALEQVENNLKTTTVYFCKKSSFDFF